MESGCAPQVAPALSRPNRRRPASLLKTSDTRAHSEEMATLSNWTGLRNLAGHVCTRFTAACNNEDSSHNGCCCAVCLGAGDGEVTARIVHARSH